MSIDWKRRLLGELSWRRLRRSVLQVIVLIYAFLIVLGLFGSNRMIFPYDGSSYGTSLPGLQMIKSGDGTAIATRHWPAPDAEQLVLLFHGNFEDIGDLDIIAEELRRLGFAVLAMDYRGYGLSEDRPTEKKCYADGRALVAHAATLGYAGNDLLLWGRSVGSGIATQLATEIDAGGLVLESPFVTAFRALTVVPLLPFDKFNNLAKIEEVSEPLFIFHGTDDEIIPEWNSAKLFEKHTGTKHRHLIEGAGHNDIWEQDLDPMLTELAAFFKPGSPAGISPPASSPSPSN